MDDLISRQAAIDAIDKIFPADPMRNDYTQGITCGAALATEYIKQLPSAQQEPLVKESRTLVKDLVKDTVSRQASCDYCHEDNDGYVAPLEKNCHAFVRRSPIDGWVLSMKYGAWRKDIPIRFCPICGRELKHDK